MDIEITQRKDNPLLNRIEVHFKVLHPGEAIPKRSNIKEKVASLMKAEKDRVVIDHVKSRFGVGESVGYAKIYRTKADAQAIENEHILKRNNLFESKKTEEE